MRERRSDGTRGKALEGCRLEGRGEGGLGHRGKQGRTAAGSCFFAKKAVGDTQISPILHSCTWDAATYGLKPVALSRALWGGQKTWAQGQQVEGSQGLYGQGRARDTALLKV